MKSLREFLGLCNHKWIIIEKLQLTKFLASDRKNTEYKYGIEYVLQCSVCGKIKHYRV